MEKLLAWISSSDSGVSADEDILLAGDFNACQYGAGVLQVVRCFLVHVRKRALVDENGNLAGCGCGWGFYENRFR